VTLRLAAADPDDVVDEFHKRYYAPAHQTTYLGLPLWKSPLDMFVYQELIYETKPELIIETGTAFGASALYFAHFMEKAGIDGRIVSIDIARGDSFQGYKLPRHPRITYLRGKPSTDKDVLKYVHGVADELASRMVILDSDHSKTNVLAELDAYWKWATDWLVVEDVNVNSHPVLPEHGPGPFEAVEEWLPHHPEFAAREPWAKYLLSFHSWLQRK
jgi:cephalosporin hydroxylase